MNQCGKVTNLRLWTTYVMLIFIFVSTMAQTKRALVIGISDYLQAGDNSWSAIHGANDAALITPVLQKQGFKTTMICNKTATAKKIRRELNNLVASCKKGDIIYIHFSGHGQPFEDLNGDEEDGWDESIIPYDAQKKYQKGKYEGAKHILDDELLTYFQNLRRAVGSRGFVCVVVDACHAGGSSRGDDEIDEEKDVSFVRGTKQGFTPNGKEFRPRINSRSNFAIPQLAGGADILLLEACRSYQSNYEIQQAGKFYGPLSYYVSQVLSRQTLTASTSWMMEVKEMMDSDQRLTRQNMVYETSLK